LDVFEDPQVLRKQIMRIKTDSRPIESPKDPRGDVLFELYSLVADEAAKDEMAAVYRRGGFGYGEVKKALADAAVAYFDGPRAHRAELAARPDAVRQILGDGANRARSRAEQVLSRVKEACGIRW
jgi:tryptophanyl-tRNA synthetase